jgi:hypothetical protein
MIQIISLTTPVMNSDAHWGKTEKTEDEREIYKYLIDERSWTDDDILTDIDGKDYCIDDLVGKTVLVGEEEIEINS